MQAGILISILAGISVLNALVLLGWMFWLGSRGGDGHPNWSREQMRPFLMWGLFYVNPGDSRGWVEKPIGIGWTPNFRERRNALIFAAMIGVAAVIGIAISVVAVVLQPA